MPTISPNATSTSQPAPPTPERNEADAGLFGTNLGATSQDLDARARHRLSTTAMQQALEAAL